MQKIESDELAKAIRDSLSEWESEKWKHIEDLADIKGEELKSKVIEDAPEHLGKYKKGFKIRKEKSYRKIKVGVYNTSKRAPLMHLLESGHAKVGGGRVKAIPHLRENEKEVSEEFVKEVAKIYESN